MLTHTLTGLISGQSYDVRISATTSVAVGEPSPVATASPLFVPLDVPNLRAAPGSEVLLVEWDQPMSPDHNALDYNLRTTVNSVVSTYEGIVDRHMLLTDLTNDAEVTIEVQARAAAGFGEYASLQATPYYPTLALDNYTPHDDEDARFLITTTNGPANRASRDLLNLDADPPVGTVVGDRTVPPTPYRYGRVANRFVTLRSFFISGEGWDLYQTANPNVSIYNLLEDPDLDVILMMEVAISDAQTGSTFMNIPVGSLPRFRARTWQGRRV